MLLSIASESGLGAGGGSAALLAVGAETAGGRAGSAATLGEEVEEGGEAEQCEGEPYPVATGAAGGARSSCE